MCHQDLVRITSGVNSSSSISVTELEFVDYLIIKTLPQSNQKLLKQLLNVFLIWNWETFNDFKFVIPAFARDYKEIWWRRVGTNPYYHLTIEAANNKAWQILLYHIYCTTANFSINKLQSQFTSFIDNGQTVSKKEAQCMVGKDEDTIWRKGNYR